MKRTAFTMIELIFVIVVLGILAALIVVKLSAVRDDARATTMISDFNNGVRVINSMAYASDEIPIVDEQVQSTEVLTTTADTMTAHVGSTVCATGQVYPNGDFNITIVSDTGPCEVFAGLRDTRYKLKGRGVVR